MKLEFTVERVRASVTQQEVKVYCNGQFITNFGDEVDIIKPGEKYYGELVGGFASRTPDHKFIHATLFHKYDDLYHVSDGVQKIIDKAIEEEVAAARTRAADGPTGPSAGAGAQEDTGDPDIVYRYYRGGAGRQEAVEYDIWDDDPTTCVVNVQSLLYGVTTFPCGNGDDVKLTPEQRLAILEKVQEEREAIKAKYTPVKTYAGWQESGLPTFGDYCKPGDMVDQEMVDYFVNVLPPKLMRQSCTQAGEPHSSEPDDKGRFRSTYITFRRLGETVWRFCGYCFYQETENRADPETTLERCIRQARKEFGR